MDFTLWLASRRERGEDRFHDDVQNRDEEQVQHGGEQHATNNRGSDRVTANLSSAGCEVQRQDAEDKRERRHENGAQAKFGGFDRGFGDRSSLFQQLLGELDNQNRVLRRESDQHHQSDLHVNIIHQPAQRDEQQRSQYSHWDGEQNNERQREALVLRGQSEIDHQQSQAEDNDCLAAGFHFL